MLPRSMLLRIPPVLEPMKIPSITTPMAGSKLFWTVRNADSPDGDCCHAAGPLRRVVDHQVGDMLARSLTSRAKLRWISVWLSALIAMATSWMFSSTLARGDRRLFETGHFLGNRHSDAQGRCKTRGDSRSQRHVDHPLVDSPLLANAMALILYVFRNQDFAPPGGATPRSSSVSRRARNL